MMEVIEANTTDLERTNRALTKRNRDLVDARAQAATDPLTGPGNHRSFHKSLREEFARAQEAGTALGLIIIDVDQFKDVNDSMGHMAGDQALRDLSAALTRVVKKENTYRYGGDELAVLLPQARCDEARSVAESLRLAVTEINTNETTKLSASLGVACFPESASTPEELVYRADMAMYWAKSTGKNRVTAWDSVFEANMRAATTPRHRVTPAQPGN
jgi:two-component system cell cycle response regulator